MLFPIEFTDTGAHSDMTLTKAVTKGSYTGYLSGDISSPWQNTASGRPWLKNIATGRHGSQLVSHLTKQRGRWMLLLAYFSFLCNPGPEVMGWCGLHSKVCLALSETSPGASPSRPRYVSWMILHPVQLTLKRNCRHQVELPTLASPSIHPRPGCQNKCFKWSVNSFSRRWVTESAHKTNVALLQTLWFAVWWNLDFIPD